MKKKLGPFSLPANSLVLRRLPEVDQTSPAGGERHAQFGCDVDELPLVIGFKRASSAPVIGDKHTELTITVTVKAHH